VIWGDIVAWSFAVCPVDEGGCSSEVSEYRDARTLSPVGALPAGHRVVSAGSDGILVSSSNQDGQTTYSLVRPGQPESAALDVAGSVVRADGGHVAWIDPMGSPKVAPLPVVAPNPPRDLGNPLALASFNPSSGPWVAEILTSAPLTNCEVTISSTAGVLRTLACDADNMALGEAIISWDGKNGAGAIAPPGTYAWTLSGDNADGPLQAADGSAGPVRGQVVLADTAPPTVTLTAPTGQATLTSTVKVVWSARDAASGVLSSDVRLQRAPYNGDLGNWTYPTSWQAVTGSTVTMTTAARGYTYCFSVRSRDRAGNISAWTTQRCAAIPLDDRSLTAGTGWSRRTGSAYYAGTYTVATRAAIALTRTGVRARRVALVATTCATCGTVDLYLGSTRIERVSLRSTTTRRKVVLGGLTFTRLRQGTLTIRTISTGRVEIDGLVVWRQ
jgi:hypothetical protein